VGINRRKKVVSGEWLVAAEYIITKKMVRMRGVMRMKMAHQANGEQMVSNSFSTALGAFI
jgi:hypothetical protein